MRDWTLLPVPPGAGVPLRWLGPPSFLRPGGWGLPLTGRSTGKHVLRCLVVSDSYSAVDCSTPGFPVQWILQTRILEWVAISPGGLPHPGIEPTSPESPTLVGRFFTAEPPKRASLVRDASACLALGTLPLCGPAQSSVTFSGSNLRAVGRLSVLTRHPAEALACHTAEPA